MAENKVKRVEVLSEITLASAYDDTQAASSRVVVEAFSSSKANLFLSYTTGAGETSNTCEVVVEGYFGAKTSSPDHPYASTDNTDVLADSGYWAPLGEHTISSGTATFTTTEYQITGTDAATTYTGQFDIDINVTKLRVKAKETGVATNAGTLTAVVLVQ